MAQSTKAERKRRQAEALQVLSDGYGTTEAASFLSDRWGTSRKTALRAINAPHIDLVNDLNEAKKTYGAAVSGIRLMNEMIIYPHKK